MVLESGETIGKLVETHDFAEKDNVTTMRIMQAYDAQEARDGAIASGMDQGHGSLLPAARGHDHPTRVADRLSILAEKEGFEPTVPLRVRRLSQPVSYTARPLFPNRP